MSLISQAIEMQSEEFLEILIDKVPLTNVDANGFNDLMRALQLGNVRIFTLLWKALEKQGQLQSMMK